MRVLIDTDVAIELLRGNRRVLDCLARHDDGIFVSTVTAAELYYGAYHSQLVERNIESVRAFLAEFERLTLTDETARRFGELKSELVRKGTSVDTFDLLIAVVALENGCAVATGNTKHFSRIPGLQLENWIADEG